MLAVDTTHRPALRPVASSRTYVGLDADTFGGMTPIGRMVRDAQVFGLIDETETAEGWNLGQLENLQQSVNDAWDRYGCLVSCLPTELFDRHIRIHGEAVRIALYRGWSGELATDNET